MKIFFESIYLERKNIYILFLISFIFFLIINFLFDTGPLEFKIEDVYLKIGSFVQLLILYAVLLKITFFIRLILFRTKPRNRILFLISILIWIIVLGSVIFQNIQFTGKDSISIFTQVIGGIVGGFIIIWILTLLSYNWKMQRAAKKEALSKFEEKE